MCRSTMFDKRTITYSAYCLLKPWINQKKIRRIYLSSVSWLMVTQMEKAWLKQYVSVCVCVWVTMYVSVCSVVCMLHYTTWQVQSPVGWHCCILHLAEHIQHIRGVTNPFLAARTFQRVSVPVNNTSSGFHTSELMCVWHTDTHTWNSATNRSVCDCEREICGRLCRRISGVCMCVRFCVKHPCLNGVFRVVNQRRGWGECQSVRLAPVKSPRALSFSVLTPLNLSLSSLTLTHSTSIDTRYPAALQRPEENPLQWLSVWGEPRSIQEKKGLYNAPTYRTTRCEWICWLFDFFSWHFWMDKREKKTITDRMIDQQPEQICQTLAENAESSLASICKLISPSLSSHTRKCIGPLSLASVSGVRCLGSTEKRSKVIEQWVLLKYLLASFRDIM